MCLAVPVQPQWVEDVSSKPGLRQTVKELSSRAAHQPCSTQRAPCVLSSSIEVQPSSPARSWACFAQLCLLDPRRGAGWGMPRTRSGCRSHAGTAATPGTDPRGLRQVHTTCGRYAQGSEDWLACPDRPGMTTAAQHCKRMARCACPCPHTTSFKAASTGPASRKPAQTCLSHAAHAARHSQQSACNTSILSLLHVL